MGNFPPFLLIFALHFLPAPVTVSVYPAINTGDMRVRAIIEKHEGNRWLVLEAIRFEVLKERRTPFQIDGAQSQRVFTPTNKCICWFDLPAGEYEAVATLTRIVDGQEKRYVDRRPFKVIGME